MVSIYYNTLKQNIYETIYDIIDGVTSIDVIGGFPEKLEVLPCIVIGKPSIEVMNIALSGSLKVYGITIIITIQSTKNKEADSTSDEVRTALIDNEATLFGTNNLYDMDITEDDGGEDLIEGKQVHSNVLTVNFKWDNRQT